MRKQIELIGNHPNLENIFGTWLNVKDFDSSPTKCHRELIEKDDVEFENITLWMAEKLVSHHYSNFRIEQLKKKYKELGFEKYAEQNRRLPDADNVKKGNATEILLTEYIQSTLNRELIKVYKLKYNPNVDQALKGDDTLMIDLFEKEGKDDIKIFLGESKFRKTPSKKVIDDISLSLNKDKMPLSYSFLVEEIAKTNEELASKLDEFIVQDIKDKGQLIYTGLLLSNKKSSRFVEEHLNNDNQNLIIISIGINEPEELINLAFEKAKELISNPINL